jgi:hypothetical protein
MWQSANDIKRAFGRKIYFMPYFLQIDKRENMLTWVPGCRPLHSINQGPGSAEIHLNQR